MAIKPLNAHYSMENPATVYDEESLTALQLAARTTGKVNEVVEQINKNTADLPDMVGDTVQAHIDSGKFDAQLNEYGGDLKQQMSAAESRMNSKYEVLEDTLEYRINALVGQVKSGATSMDAEIIDARTGANGKQYGSLSASISNQILSANRHAQAVVYMGTNGTIHISIGTEGAAVIEFITNSELTCKANGVSTSLNWAEITTDIAEHYENPETSRHIITCPYGNALLFDTITGKFKFDLSTLEKSRYTDVLCLMNQYGKPFTGCFINEAMYNYYAAAGANRDQFCYIGLGKSLEIGRVEGSDDYYIRTNGGLNWWLSGVQHWAYWEDICENIPDRVTKDANGITTITVPSGYCLTLDTVKKTLDIKPLKEMKTHDLNLFANINTQWFKGCIAEQYVARMAQSYATEKKSNTPNPDIIKTFAGRLKNTGDTECFMFFTDPHITGAGDSPWLDNFNYYMRCLSAAYNSAPVDFAVCGGDWLNWQDTPEQAIYKLGVINGEMRNIFGDNFYQVLGNHDTNYQGAERLSDQTVENVFFRKTGRRYYKFAGKHTTFFVFDTGLDSEPAITASGKMEQILWYANELKNTNGNIALFGHIYKTFNADENGAPMADLVTKIAQAYNNRATIVVDGQSFNYAGATGKVRFFMAGHSHLDMTETINGIPVTATDMLTSNATGTYDLVLVDYKNNKLYLDRAGTGESRVINI